jgi:ABC-type amino acid transport substrate-binding protein
MRYFMTIVAFSLLSGCGVSESPSEVMAPTGTLRAVFLGGNPVQGRLDSETGTASGTVPDLVERLAGQLGVSYTLLPAENARAVMDRLIDGEADLGFLAYSESRALEVDYGAAYLVMFSSYLVGANSSFETSADVDRSGISVGAVRESSIRYRHKLNLRCCWPAERSTRSQSIANARLMLKRLPHPSCVRFPTALWKSIKHLLFQKATLGSLR